MLFLFSVPFLCLNEFGTETGANKNKQHKSGSKQLCETEAAFIFLYDAFCVVVLCMQKLGIVAC